MKNKINSAKMKMKTLSGFEIEMHLLYRFSKYES